MLFGAILVWQARVRKAHPDVPLLAIVLMHQMSFCLLMLLLAPFLPIVGSVCHRFTCAADQRPERPHSVPVAFMPA